MPPNFPVGCAIPHVCPHLPVCQFIYLWTNPPRLLTARVLAYHCPVGTTGGDGRIATGTDQHFRRRVLFNTVRRQLMARACPSGHLPSYPSP